MDMNGQKFVKPWGMTDSAVMASLRTFDAPKITSLIGNGRARVGGQPVTADELARYMPGAQLGPSPKPGFYTVSIGGRLVSGEDGKPMFIPIGGSDVR